MRIVAIVIMLSAFIAGCDKLPFFAPPVTAPSEPKVTQYSPQNDPARIPFEETINLIQGIDGAGDSYKNAAASVAQLQKAYPASPFPLIAAADLEYMIWAMEGAVAPEHIRALINRSLAISRAVPNAYVVLAKLDLRQANLPAAIDNATKAYRLDPDKPEVRFVMARTAEQRKAFDEAETHYRKYLEVSQRPNRQSNIYLWMARMFVSMNPPQIDKAEEAYLAALQLDPNVPIKVDEYANFLLFQRGDYEGALHYAAQSSFSARLPAFAMYTKWADGFGNKGAHFKARSKQSAAPLKVTVADLRKIEEATGITPDMAFVEMAASPSLDYAVKTLYKARAASNIDVKTPGPCGCTALIKAAGGNNFELAKFLIANKANVNGTDADGNTALSRFIPTKNWEAVKYLLDQGARVNFTNKTGFTPLQHVYFYANSDAEGLKLLVEHKADPTIPFYDGTTPLYHAVRSRNGELVALFVKHGADPNEKHKYTQVYGDRPVPILSLAARWGAEGMVPALLDAGADPWSVEEGDLEYFVLARPKELKMIRAAQAAHPKPAAETAVPAQSQPGQPVSSAKK